MRLHNMRYEVKKIKAQIPEWIKGSLQVAMTLSYLGCNHTLLLGLSHLECNL